MLSPTEAAAADDMVERTLVAACHAVTLDGVTLDDALAVHFAWLGQRFPLVHALIVARLRETASPLLVYTPDEGGCDD